VAGSSLNAFSGACATGVDAFSVVPSGDEPRLPGADALGDPGFPCWRVHATATASAHTIDVNQIFRFIDKPLPKNVIRVERLGRLTRGNCPEDPDALADHDTQQLPQAKENSEH
jgi:hypothetical protein